MQWLHLRRRKNSNSNPDLLSSTLIPNLVPNPNPIPDPNGQWSDDEPGNKQGATCYRYCY